MEATSSVNGYPLLVEVPVCAFRPYTSREYQDTFPVPTPASVYGMLLSLLGMPRENKDIHRGAEMALAVERAPRRSKVFRKLRRGSDLHDTRPDYQDLLMDLRLWIWLRLGTDSAQPPLADRVVEALAYPEKIIRSGGLSLGESSYLVDSISHSKQPPDSVVFVRPDANGFYSLPVWVDHQNARDTRLERFSVGDPEPVEAGLDTAWFSIGGSNA
jgi:CRISPR-associated protein Cas5/DevS